MYESINVLGIEVRPWSGGVKASSDVLSGDVDEDLHLIPRLLRTRAHLTTQRVVTLDSTGDISFPLNTRATNHDQPFLG